MIDFQIGNDDFWKIIKVGWRRRGGRRPRRSPAGRDSSSRPPDRCAHHFALAKCGEHSRFAKAMRSEGDQSGISSLKIKKRLIFKEEMTIFEKRSNARHVFLKEKYQFHQDRPHDVHSIYVPPIPVSKSTKWSIYLPEWVVHKFFRWVSGWVSGGVSRGVSRGISVRARPAHTPDIALAGKNPMPRSPKDIINPKIYIFWEKKKTRGI